MPVQQKFSLQTAWVVVKVLPRGYLVRLACSGRTRLWLEYGENVSGTNVKTTHDLDQQIFEGEIISWLLESFPGGCLGHSLSLSQFLFTKIKVKTSLSVQSN